MRLTPAAREEPDALAQLAQLGAGFGYFPGFCLGRLESDQMVRRREAGISACSANLASFCRETPAFLLGRVSYPIKPGLTADPGIRRGILTRFSMRFRE